MSDTGVGDELTVVGQVTRGVALPDKDRWTRVANFNTYDALPLLVMEEYCEQPCLFGNCLKVEIKVRGFI